MDNIDEFPKTEYWAYFETFLDETGNRWTCRLWPRADAPNPTVRLLAEQSGIGGEAGALDWARSQMANYKR